MIKKMNEYNKINEYKEWARCFNKLSDDKKKWVEVSLKLRKQQEERFTKGYVFYPYVLVNIRGLIRYQQKHKKVLK